MTKNIVVRQIVSGSPAPKKCEGLQQMIGYDFYQQSWTKIHCCWRPRRLTRGSRPNKKYAPKPDTRR
jgi:hypothetical protein